MTNKLLQLPKEDLENVLQARNKFIAAVAEADKATSAAKIAELEAKVSLQDVYLKYNLHQDCRIDPKNGDIAWPEEPVVEEPVVEEVKEQS